jgi:D-alanyl-D-alanine carboxypeptidase
VRLALASLLLAGSAEVQQPARQAAAADVIHSRLQRVLDSLRSVSGSPGITLGVALPDGRVLGLASGMADTARRIPLEPDDLLLAGSVGKTFFAALALALIQDGKLSLDAPISTWLGSEPWFSRLPNGPAVTVRMLMNHTSGLVRYEFKDAFTRDLTAGPDRIWRPEELVAYLLDEPAPFEAGKGWDYSDTNYIVLGMILERITGNTAYAEIQQRFLDPHGLRDVIPSTARRIPGLAQSYAGLPNPFGGRDEMLDAEGRLAINPQFEWAGGGFATSAPALARWARVFYEGAAVDSVTVARAIAEAVPARLGPEVRYGLGVIVWPGADGPVVGHSGFFPGSFTEMRYFTGGRFAIALQLNTSNGRALRARPAAMVNALATVVRRSTGAAR